REMIREGALRTGEPAGAPRELGEDDAALHLPDEVVVEDRSAVRRVRVDDPLGEMNAPADDGAERPEHARVPRDERAFREDSLGERRRAGRAISVPRPVVEALGAEREPQPERAVAGMEREPVPFDEEVPPVAPPPHVEMELLDLALVGEIARGAGDAERGAEPRRDRRPAKQRAEVDAVAQPVEEIER